MIHPHSPSPRYLAVPGIGFPQNISVGPTVVDVAAAFGDWPRVTVTKSRKTDDDQHDAPTQLIDHIAWLLVRR